MIPSFNQFNISSATLNGDKVDIKDVLNREIVVTAYKISPSKHYKRNGAENYVRIQFYYADDETEEKKVIFTGSSILMEQLDALKEEMDEKNIEFIFKTTIVRISDYYSFS